MTGFPGYDLEVSTDGTLTSLTLTDLEELNIQDNASTPTGAVQWQIPGGFFEYDLVFVSGWGKWKM